MKALPTPTSSTSSDTAVSLFGGLSPQTALVAFNGRKSASRLAFITRNAQAPTVRTAIAMHLVDWAVQAVDGTRVGANVAGARTYDAAGLRRLLGRVQAAIDDLEAQHAAGDAAAPARLASGSASPAASARGACPCGCIAPPGRSAAPARPSGSVRGTGAMGVAWRSGRMRAPCGRTAPG